MKKLLAVLTIILCYTNIEAFEPVGAVLYAPDHAELFIYANPVDLSGKEIPVDTLSLACCDYTSEYDVENWYEIVVTDVFAHRYKIKYDPDGLDWGEDVKKGWIDKAYVGLFRNITEAGGLELYISPSTESDYIEIPYDEAAQCVVLLDVGPGEFRKVLLKTYGGKYYEGWIDIYCRLSTNGCN